MQFSWQVEYIACPCHGRNASASGGGHRASDDGDLVQALLSLLPVVAQGHATTE